MSGFFDQDADPDLPPDFDLPGEADDDHDPGTCPNCMKIVFMDAMAELETRAMGAYLVVSGRGTMAFPADEWVKIFVAFRTLVDMAEDAVAAGVVGTPFPWEKYATDEEDDDDEAL